MDPHRLLVFVPLLLASACESPSGSDVGETGETGGLTIDEDAVVAMAVAYGDFERITATATPSQHGLADTVHVWVPSAYAADYRAIDPDDPNATAAAFDPGALIVKEHLDADAQPSGLTIMYKGPAGYAPEADDWWWAQAELDGTLNDAGTVDYCVGCHTPQQPTDWLFGVPLDNQN